eukprot:TRINITY_DN10500_c0_g1_i1.p1 TRINITY_DN10500_c0_g1~~TRINITY_DN10500_c0_g1_i1.p1  ORF type:complete len:478 (+),score=101.41 TRINITY_DN10500_c0_g1_i1:107-1435(+)
MELRKRRSSAKKVSASLWVGYAADEETPEMIMKKFEALERLKANIAAQQQKNQQQKPGGDGEPNGPPVADAPSAVLDSVASSSTDTVGHDPGPQDVQLTEQQLEKVFKMTSMFVVPTGSREVVYDVGEGFQDQDLLNQLAVDDDSSGDEEAFFNVGDGPKKPRAKRERSTKKRERNPAADSGRDKSRMKLVSMEVVGMDGYTYTVKKKVKLKDPLEPDYVRIPPFPVPLTWAKSVEPFALAPSEAPAGSHYVETNIVDFDLLSFGKTFVGVLLDVPWKTPRLNGPGRVTAAELVGLRLDQVLPAGLAFIWVEKETIADAVKLFTSWGFTYVENLSWVRRYPNHSIVTEDYDYFTKSKAILLIFKRGDGITLRHQRNPDVVFDFVRRDKYLAEDKPENVYDMIETLLPEGNYKEETKEGRFLELWGRKNMPRKGWTSLIQKRL